MYFVVYTNLQTVTLRSKTFNMSLKPLKVATNEVPESKKSDIRIIEIGGSSVSDFNQASVEAKNAKAIQDELGEELRAAGLAALYEIAVGNPDTPPSSVKLQDDLGSTVMLTSQNRYSDFDPQIVEPVFEALGAPIRDFAQYIVRAKFDDSIFLAKPGTTAATSEEGKFSTKIYNVYKRAIDQATAQLVRDGLLPAETQAPLLTTQVATVFPDFHQRRWRSFPTVEQQRSLYAVIKNTIVLKPVIEREAEPTRSESVKPSKSRR